MSRFLKFCNIVLFTTILPINSYCQSNNYFDYYKIINKAEIAFFKNNHVVCDSLFQIAFKSFQHGFSDDFLFAAKNAILLKDNEKLLSYLTEGFRNGLLFEIVKEDSIFKYLKNILDKKRLSKSYKIIRKNYLSNLDMELRNEIAQMVKEDQKYRGWWYERKPWKKQQPLLKKVDSLNFIKLQSICEMSGFPDNSLVGDDDDIGWVDVPVLLRHMDSIKLKLLEPYIMTSIQKGYFKPFDYVSALDYTSMFKTTFEDLDEDGNHILIIQQKYGTMLGSENGVEIILPVSSLNDINTERIKYGLESIEDYAFKSGCELPREGFYKRVFK